MYFCFLFLARFVALAGMLTAQKGMARPNVVFIMAADPGPGWVDYAIVKIEPGHLRFLATK